MDKKLKSLRTKLLLATSVFSSIALAGCGNSNSCGCNNANKEDEGYWVVLRQKYDILYNTEDYSVGYCSINFKPKGAEKKVTATGTWFIFDKKPDAKMYDYFYDGYTNTFVPSESLTTSSTPAEQSL